MILLSLKMLWKNKVKLVLQYKESKENCVISNIYIYIYVSTYTCFVLPRTHQCIIYYILYVCTNISRAFILFTAVWAPTTPTFPSPSLFYQFFSPVALRGEILVMSGLENKWEVIDFFPICTTKTNGLGLRRGLMRVAEQR